MLISTPALYVIILHYNFCRPIIYTVVVTSIWFQMLTKSDRDICPTYNFRNQKYVLLYIAELLMCEKSGNNQRFVSIFSVGIYLGLHCENTCPRNIAKNINKGQI